MADVESSKHLKLCSTSEEAIDRISNLPDSLLSYILSLMPTRYAVRTSILSTRWKFLWTYIINLHFDDALLIGGVNEGRFKRFVYRVLLLLKPPRISKFHLSCKKICLNSLHINGWISTAIERGVEEMDVKAYCLKNPLPSRLFSCKTLKVLKLDGEYFSMKLSSCSVNLPNLKVFHSIRVRYSDGESVSKFFNGCPALEDLVIQRLSCDGALNFNLSCSSLKRLKIHFGTSPVLPSVVEINTPALEYLDLTDGMSSKISLANMVSLVEAKIDACLCKRQGDDNDNILLQFFNGLSDAKFLSLSRRTLEALSFASDQFDHPKFDNLIRLKVSILNESQEWKPVSSFRANSVNLEELIYN